MARGTKSPPAGRRASPRLPLDSLSPAGRRRGLPRALLFYKGGARLTCKGSDSLEDLKNLEAQGVEILTCGTCLNHYGLTEELAVGGVTNMYAIVEKLAAAGKVVKP